MTDSELLDCISEIPYFYHKIELRPGIVTPGWAPINSSAYCIPERMDGELVVDLGCWDGYWSFRALHGGANAVVAVDNFSDTLGSVHNVKRQGWKGFDICANALGVVSKITKREIDLDCERLGNLEADRIFCFGLLYHCQNPLYVLKSMHDATKPGGWAHIELAILDNLQSPYTGLPHNPAGCYAEFYPGEEFGKNKSNWWVPTLKCAAAWLQAVGYVDIEGWKLTEQPQSLAECRGFLRARKPAS